MNNMLATRSTKPGEGTVFQVTQFHKDTEKLYEQIKSLIQQQQGESERKLCEIRLIEDAIFNEKQMLLSKQSELDRKKQEISSQQCELVKKERDRRNADDLYEQKKREYQKKKKECIISSVATGAGTVVVSLLTLGLGAIPAATAAATGTAATTAVVTATLLAMEAAEKRKDYAYYAYTTCQNDLRNAQEDLDILKTEKNRLDSNLHDLKKKVEKINKEKDIISNNLKGLNDALNALKQRCFDFQRISSASQILKDNVVHESEMGKYQSFKNTIIIYQEMLQRINEHNKNHPNDQFYLHDQLQALEKNIEMYSLSIECTENKTGAIGDNQEIDILDCFC